jgi:hypothetical protein
MRSLALAAEGLGAADPDPYLALLGPGESDAMRSAMLTMSGCGLTVRALWREIGMVDPRLVAPYEPGVVMSTIQNMAHEADAWHANGEGIPGLQIGDVVYVSEPDHVGTIVDVERPGDGTARVRTVDGGSLDAAGRQVVVSYARTFGYDGSVTAGPMAGQGRAVVGTVDLEAMVRHFGGAGFHVGELALVAAMGLGGVFLWRNVPELRGGAKRLAAKARRLV